MFLASELQRLYYGRHPVRSPELQFYFHSDETLGSHFNRATSTIVVQVQTASPALSLRRLVHELVHACHEEPVAERATEEYGDVTQAERARITEESQTRTLENDIMSEIQDSAAATESGLRESRESETAEEDVRDSFRSGRPRLTYQEYFIIDEMKNRINVPEFNEEAAIQTAHQMISTGLVDFDPASNFEITEEEVLAHRRRVESPRPVDSPGIDEAIDCVDLYWATSIRERETQGFIDRLRDISPGGPEFIFLYYSRFGIDRLDPRGNETEHRIYLHNIRFQMDTDYRLQRGLRSLSDVFIPWYDTIPEDQKSEALDLFEWILIQERMSVEWLETERSTPDPTIRSAHLLYLQNRIGTDLRGISESR